MHEPPPAWQQGPQVWRGAMDRVASSPIEWSPRVARGAAPTLHAATLEEAVRGQRAGERRRLAPSAGAVLRAERLQPLSVAAGRDAHRAAVTAHGGRGGTAAVERDAVVVLGAARRIRRA